MASLDALIRLSWQPRRGGQDTAFEPWVRDRVESFSYTDKSNGADEGEIVLANEDLRLLDNPITEIGTKITIQWGYRSETHEPRRLQIRERKGFRKLTLSGPVDEVSFFIGSQRTRTFEDSTPFEVAEQLAREQGFIQSDSRVIESGDIVSPRRGIVQSSETDMAFLLRLARDTGAVFYISGEIFHFHERRLGRQPTRTLTYWNDSRGVFIGEPQVTIAAQGRSGGVNRSGHSARQRSTVSGSASNSTDQNRPSLGEEVTISEPDDFSFEEFDVDLVEGLPVTVPPEPVSTPNQPQDSQAASETTTAETSEEATSEAQQQFRRAERQTIKLTQGFIGLPWLQADTTVRLEGLGEKLSGNYYAEEAKHTVNNNGYRTNVTFSRNAGSRSRGSAGNRAQNQAAFSESLPYSPQSVPDDIQGFQNTGFTSVSEIEELDYGLDEEGNPVSTWAER
jgi:phage protein D